MKQTRGVCTYCQNAAAEDRDHVLARCLFIAPLPSNLPTVPSCRLCNRSKAVDDEFLRDYLVADIVGSQSPTAKRIFEAKTRKASSRNSSELARTVRRKGSVKPLHTNSGIYLGDFPQAPVDPERFDRLFKKVIGGLYFRFTGGDHIPISYPCEVLRIMPWEERRAWTTFQEFNLNHCGPFADVFRGACARVEEDLRSTMWWLTFYERVHFVVTAIGVP